MKKNHNPPCSSNTTFCAPFAINSSLGRLGKVSGTSVGASTLNESKLHRLANWNHQRDKRTSDSYQHAMWLQDSPPQSAAPLAAPSAPWVCSIPSAPWSHLRSLVGSPLLHPGRRGSRSSHLKPLPSTSVFGCRLSPSAFWDRSSEDAEDAEDLSCSAWLFSWQFDKINASTNVCSNNASNSPHICASLRISRFHLNAVAMSLALEFRTCRPQGCFGPCGSNISQPCTFCCHGRLLGTAIWHPRSRGLGQVTS